MSTRQKLLLAVIASSTLLLGCSTPRHSEHWEYKTVTLSNWPAADAQLNELGAEGWGVVGFSRNEGGSNTSTFVLKRRKWKWDGLTRSLDRTRPSQVSRSFHPLPRFLERNPTHLTYLLVAERWGWVDRTEDFPVRLRFSWVNNVERTQSWRLRGIATAICGRKIPRPLRIKGFPSVTAGYVNVAANQAMCNIFRDLCLTLVLGVTIAWKSCLGQTSQYGWNLLFRPLLSQPVSGTFLNFIRNKFENLISIPGNRCNN